MASETAVAASCTTIVRVETPRGDSAETATVVRLYVAPGDTVETGAAVCLLHTARFLYALPATASGSVEQCFVEAGAEIKPGDPLLSIVAFPPEPSAIAQEPLPPALRATPLARAIAAAHSLDLRKLAGTSPGGRIRAADVRTALGASSNGHVLAPATVTTIPSSEARMPAFVIHDQRSQAITAIEVNGEPDAVIVHAAIQALIEHPRLNSRWTDEGVLLYGRIDLGLWHDTAGNRNLMLLPNAADLSLRGIRRAIVNIPRVAEKALIEAMPATFTVCFTDTGWWSEAIIPTSSAVLLHVGSAASRVVVDPITEHLAIRRRRLLALIYDARYITQIEADSLLSAVRARVEQRRRL